jgi:hypothetical protein
MPARTLIATLPSGLGRPSAGVSAPLIAGVVLMGGAFGLDVLAHGAGIESLEPVAHGAGMLGMVVTWGTVVIDGLRIPGNRS